MPLVHPRSMAAVVPRNVTLNSTSLNTISNATSSTKALSSSIPSGSWFTCLITKIPGVPWLKTKLGHLLHGPTFDMSPTELHTYFLSQKLAREKEFLRQEKEAEFKVAKYLVTHHPDFYWSKYIEKFERGSEDRKRGFFLFILTNKEVYGYYYGRLRRHISWVNRELIEMGLRPVTVNIVKDIVNEESTVGEQKHGKGLRKRDVQSTWEDMSEQERRMFREMNEIVDGLDISTLQEQSTIPPPSKRIHRARPFRINYN